MPCVYAAYPCPNFAIVLYGSCRRRRRGRPELAALVVAQIHDLRRRIDDRVVAPWSQPVVIAVLRPRSSQARVCGDEPETLVRNDVRPWRGRPGGDVKLAAVVGEPAESVEERSGSVSESGPLCSGTAGFFLIRGGGTDGSSGRRNCTSRAPREPSRIARATARSSTRSPSDMRSARRRKRPPGRSSHACDGPASAIRCRSSCTSCR